jgi:hypothetical protein
MCTWHFSSVVYFVHCHCLFTLSANVSVACALAELKVGSLMEVPKVERIYLLEPLHKAVIAQLRSVIGIHSKRFVLKF